MLRFVIQISIFFFPPGTFQVEARTLVKRKETRRLVKRKKSARKYKRIRNSPLLDSRDLRDFHGCMIGGRFIYLSVAAILYFDALSPRLKFNPI